MSRNPTSAETDLTERARMAGITPAGSAALVAFWPQVERMLPKVLDGFYSHLAEAPAMQGLTPTRIAGSGKHQAAHWARLFTGRFDADYLDGVRRIGEAHARIGLAPRWYIAGYSFVLPHLMSEAVRAHRFSATRRTTTIHAITSAVMLDMDIAISVYFDGTVANASADRTSRVADLAREFEGEAEALTTAIAAAARQLSGTATEMTGMAEAATQQAGAVTAASDQTSHSVEMMAASAEELTASNGEIARQVTHASSISSRMAEEARRTDDVVQQLAERARRIGDVIGLISTIAGQTNLLALNATIEAARAGEAGKGFAVVASEVKGLATQTAKATEEISQQIAAIQAATQQAVEAIRHITGTITEVESVSTAIAAAVEEQNAAMQEIARGLQQSSEGTRTLSGTIAGVEGMARDTGHAAHGVQGASAELSSQAENLGAIVRGFVEHVKAA